MYREMSLYRHCKAGAVKEEFLLFCWRRPVQKCSCVIVQLHHKRLQKKVSHFYMEDCWNVQTVGQSETVNCKLILTPTSQHSRVNEVLWPVFSFLSKVVCIENKELANRRAGAAWPHHMSGSNYGTFLQTPLNVETGNMEGRQRW